MKRQISVAVQSIWSIDRWVTIRICEGFSIVGVFILYLCAEYVIVREYYMTDAPISITVLASALGNSIRWKALRELSTGEALMTVELSERVGAAANTLSRHMKVLLSGGLVTQNRAGQYAIPAGRLISKEERVVDYGTCLLRLGKSGVG